MIDGVRKWHVQDVQMDGQMTGGKTTVSAYLLYSYLSIGRLRRVYIEKEREREKGIERGGIRRVRRD